MWLKYIPNFLFNLYLMSTGSQCDLESDGSSALTALTSQVTFISIALHTTQLYTNSKKFNSVISNSKKDCYYSACVISVLIQFSSITVSMLQNVALQFNSDNSASSSFVSFKLYKQAKRQQW